MDLIGHLAVIEASGVLPGDYLWGDGVFMAFFPNLAHCHEWAYRELWAAHRGEDPDAKAIQGHMICDWVIHYGPRRTTTLERVGWAYKEVHRGIERLDTFFTRHLQRGSLTVDPRASGDRARVERDFGHTLIECAVDLLLAERFVDAGRLRDVQGRFRKLADEEFADALVDDTFERLNGYTTEPRAVLRRTAREYARWSRTLNDARAYAAMTLCAKYNLAEDPDVVDFNLEVLDQVGRELDHAGVEEMFVEIAQRIADPEIALND